VVLFLPSLLFLSGFWWCAYWAGVFLLYARGSEKIVTLVAGAFFVGAGLLAASSAQELYLSQAPPHVSNLRCYQHRIEIGADAYLAQYAGSQDPRRENYAFLLASRHLVHGSYAKAEEIFKGILAKNPGDAPTANNLGCILCYEGRYQEAIQLFTKAIEAKPGLAAAHFNRGLARTKIFNFSEGKEDQEKAREVDRRFFKDHNLEKEEDWGPVPVFLPLDLTREMALGLEAERTGRTGVPKKPTRSLLALVFRPPFGIAVPALLLGFLGLSLTRKRKVFAKACFKCGRPFCPRCKTSLEFESHCGQCVHLFIKQDGVSPEARLRKNYEVEQHNRFLRTMRAALSLVAPGAGHFVEGRPFSSLFLLTFWCGFVAAFLLRAFALPLPSGVSGAPLWSAYSLVGAFLMFLLWVSFGLPRALSRQIPRPYAGTGS
jgi:tetratricopeptide (TPR) repeat protein